MKRLIKRVSALEAEKRLALVDLAALSDQELLARIRATLERDFASGALDLPDDWRVQYAANPDQIMVLVVSQCGL
jgi:hypothetical protein